jgi:asparagine synthetase B (glutamine-hydrolysing)
LYYFYTRNELIVSSNIDTIVELKEPEQFNIDKQHILERLFFYYGLSDRSYFKEIKVLKTNHFLEAGQNISEKEQFRINEFFSSNPRKGKNTLEDLSALFISRLGVYLPDKRYALSFTGGFDGRTLLGVSKHYHKNFFSYAFGAKDSEDMVIPQKQAPTLGVVFNPIVLNKAYIELFSLNKGIELIEKTDGAASFARAHYLYAAEKLAADTAYMVTGNFGSELFRAIHNPGVMFSEELISFFSNRNEQDWIQILKNSSKWKYLSNRASYSEPFEQLIADMREFKKNTSTLSTNEAFYTFVFNEVFRKYFGPEIKIQQNFIVNRAPFIDYHFMKELFETYYCGVYSDFFTNNPMKRFKGQLLYSYILKKACPELLSMRTVKGYKPSALLNHWGKLQLVANLIEKKLKKTSENDDPHLVTKAFMHNKDKWNAFPVMEDIYNSDYLKKQVQNAKYADNTLINIVSSNYFLAKILSNG